MNETGIETDAATALTPRGVLEGHREVVQHGCPTAPNGFIAGGDHVQRCR